MNTTEQIAALEARVAELADTVKLLSSAPQLAAFIVQQKRVTQIQEDAKLVAALVSGSPDERSAKICGLNAYRLRQIAELIQFADLVDICRGLPLDALGKLMRAIPIEVRIRAIAESMPAAALPDLVRVSQPSSNQRPTIAGLDELASGLAMTIPRDQWESLVTGDDGLDIRDHLRLGNVVVVQLDEREVRSHLGQSGTLDDLTWTVALVDPMAEARAAEAARRDVPISASAARRKRAEKAAESTATEPPAAEVARYQKNLADQAREARVTELAEAVSRALDRKKKKAPSK